jgi:hypothetical protein
LSLTRTSGLQAILNEFVDSEGRHILTVNTETPWHVEATDGTQCLMLRPTKWKSADATTLLPVFVVSHKRPLRDRIRAQGGKPRAVAFHHPEA